MKLLTIRWTILIALISLCSRSWAGSVSNDSLVPVRININLDIQSVSIDERQFVVLTRYRSIKIANYLDSLERSMLLLDQLKLQNKTLNKLNTNLESQLSDKDIQISDFKKIVESKNTEVNLFKDNTKILQDKLTSTEDDLRKKKNWNKFWKITCGVLATSLATTITIFSVK